jgi:hypothetical protein
MENTELRVKVAELLGWTDIKLREPWTIGDFGTSPDGRTDEGIPEYDLSVDAILQAFADKGWEFGLETISYFDDDPLRYMASNGYWELEIEDEYAAIALCKLFIVMYDLIEK